mmetsp:Transcript_8609/g.21413  ORF Transcript_8609/g.21413 Transcript_8609/m.21413 type:complete len:348 (-) Transcript_8609:102-1145(-)
MEDHPALAFETDFRCESSVSKAYPERASILCRSLMRERQRNGVTLRDTRKPSLLFLLAPGKHRLDSGVSLALRPRPTSRRNRLAHLHHARRQAFRLFHLRDPRDVRVDVELPLQPRGVHVPHLAEHRPLLPALVVFSEAPGYAGVAVGVVAVETVFVVEHERGVEGVDGGVHPLKDLFRPVHPHVSVHFALDEHFGLGRVPVRVVRLRGFELCHRVRILALIVRVLHERDTRVIRDALELVVLVVVPREIHRQLPSHDHLLQEARLPILEASCRDLRRHLHRADVPVVQVRAHVAGDGGGRAHVVALRVEDLQLALDEFVQPRARGALPALDPLHLRHVIAQLQNLC